MKRIAYLTELLYAALLAPFAHVLRLLGWRPRGVTIIGWWGSETLGDIAILGQLLTELRSSAAEREVSVVSFGASLTRRSLRQLGARDVSVVPLGVLSALQIVGSRALIIGGGPLMESPTMRFWRWNAAIAQFCGTRVMLYANGIGPLRSAACTQSVAALVRNTGFVVLRDSTSVRWAAELAGRGDAVLGADAAFDFVRAAAIAGAERQPRIALALRTPPASYLGSNDVAVATDRFLTTVARALDEVAAQRDVRFTGIVMHTGIADSDDHQVYRILRSKMQHHDRLDVAPGEHTIQSAVRAMQESRAALTVRFHAMVFALATETPFVAVDYARPEGKVSAVAEDVGRKDDVLAWDALTPETLTAKLLAAYDRGPVEAPDLEQQSRARQAVLRATAT